MVTEPTATHESPAPPPVEPPAAAVSAVSSNAPASETEASSSCPAGMVEIRGDYCPALAQICVRYIDDKPERDRCAEFRATSRCYGKTVPMRYCIDSFEYPNRAGATPQVAATWDEAAAQCKADGKRLCTDTEWTFACEGQEGRPYPYGSKRDATQCNIDKPYIMPDDEAYANLKTRDAEIARLDQREPSGSRASCVSPFGVHDMTGNVDEWVVNGAGSAAEKPYRSGLKGAYWGPLRNRCRPMTTDHNAWHSGYQIGFRCCADGA